MSVSQLVISQTKTIVSSQSGFSIPPEISIQTDNYQNRPHHLFGVKRDFFHSSTKTDKNPEEIKLSAHHKGGRDG